jgi:hypothetical protein
MPIGALLASSLVLAASLLATGVPAAHAAAKPVTAKATIAANPGNPTAPVSTSHRVSVNGVAIPVRSETVSGGSRDVAMLTKGTGTASFTVAFSKLATSAVVTVSPTALRIPVKRSGTRATFSLKGPHMLVIQATGTQPLFLYVTPPETAVPAKGAPDTVYFGPGIHEAGVIRPTSGQTVYLAAGALVRGRIDASGTTGVRVLGRGILDAGSATSRVDRTMAILFTDSSDITVEGIGVRNAQFWQTLYLNCRNVDVSWMNLMGELINNDGIDIDGVQGASFTHNFIDSGDDGFGWHALDAAANGEKETRGISAFDTTFWNVTAGNPVRIGSSMETTGWSDIDIRQSYVLRAHDSAFMIDNQDWAAITDVRVDGYYVETRPVTRTMIVAQVAQGHYSNTTGLAQQHGNGRGRIDGVTLARFYASSSGSVRILGADAGHRVTGLRLVDVRLGATRLTRSSQVRTNAFVAKIAFS